MAQQQIASLYADIGAKTDGFEKGAATVKGGLTDIATLTAVATTAAYLLSEAYDFARAGAELEMTENRFDRLAESIGTTSDALMSDLKEATRGLYSDTELMASASDLMALGLAKNHDEAVRLASVSAGLNMNMNQLVLTLTNMTTMRFDALGVRVDGFKEKVNALKAAGLSADEAFREAFLQQAEEQLETVGHAADNNIGSFMKLESAMKNSSDRAKKMASQGLSPLIRYLADSTQAINDYSAALEDIDPELAKVYNKHKVLTPEMQRVITEANRWTSMAEYYVNATNNAAAAQEGFNQSLEPTAEELKLITDANKEFLSTLGNIQNAEERYNDTVTKLTDERMELEEEKNKLLAQGYTEQHQKIQDINAALEENAEKAQQNADEHELANRRIILGLLERKLTQDGVLDDAELQWLLEKGEAWGIYSQTVIDETRKAIDEANLLAETINMLPTEKEIFIRLQTTGNLGAVGDLIPAGARAGGGSVQGGRPYVVGEQGKEVFVPSSDGNIIPNHRLGGGGANIIMNVMLDSITPDPEKVARQLYPAVKRILRSEMVN